MKLEDLKKPFAAKDIEWRIQRSGIKNDKPWALVLAYVDARAVQDRLDEVCGQANWKDEYIHIPNGVMCRLSINFGGEWISKENGAPETDIEGFKGGISKALVRAASTWGIGRYLYSLPETFCEFVDSKGPETRSAKIENKYYNWLPPKLPSWALPQEDKNTKTQSKVTISPDMGDFKDHAPPPSKPKPEELAVSPAALKEMFGEATRKGLGLEDIKSHMAKIHGVKSSQDLTVKQHAEMLQWIRKT